jgi:hypothetical protein
MHIHISPSKSILFYSGRWCWDGLAEGEKGERSILSSSSCSTCHLLLKGKSAVRLLSRARVISSHPLYNGILPFYAPSPRSSFVLSPAAPYSIFISYCYIPCCMYSRPYCIYVFHIVLYGRSGGIRSSLWERVLCVSERREFRKVKITGHQADGWGNGRNGIIAYK